MFAPPDVMFVPPDDLLIPIPIYGCKVDPFLPTGIDAEPLIPFIIGDPGGWTGVYVWTLIWALAPPIGIVASTVSGTPPVAG